MVIFGERNILTVEHDLLFSKISYFRLLGSG